jgi:hypothetical protein
MAKEGKACLDALPRGDSDSDSNETDAGPTSPASFDPADAFTITLGPDPQGEHIVSQGEVSWRVSAGSLGL